MKEQTSDRATSELRKRSHGEEPDVTLPHSREATMQRKKPGLLAQPPSARCQQAGDWPSEAQLPHQQSGNADSQIRTARPQHPSPHLKLKSFLPNLTGYKDQPRYQSDSYTSQGACLAHS